MADVNGSRPLLEIRGLYKSFGPVQALTDVNLALPSGAVTALCGDNGAGKSVTIKCISGIYQPDRVEMFWEGERVHVRNAHDAAALGIETVYQDLALADNLDIVQNMFLGRERVRHRLLDENDMERAAGDTLASLRVTTVRSIRQPVGSLSGGQRQSVAVAKAVMWNSKLVIMDEPTAALGVTQTAQVLDLIRRLRDRGLAVMLVSHNLNDVFAVADRIAVLYLGRMVAEDQTSVFDRQSVVEYMTTGGLGVTDTRSPVRDGGTDMSKADIDPPGGPAVEERTALPEAAVLVPPEIMAQSLGDYVRAQFLRIKGGESGVLPVIFALVLVTITFQSVSPQHVFLTAGNVINLLQQSAVYAVLGMAETFVLLLGEIDLSIGYVGPAVGGAITIQLVQPVTNNWPWWGAIAISLVGCAIVGASWGTLVTRLRVPSFIVTLGGLLIFNGVLLIILAYGPFSGYPSLNGRGGNLRGVYDLMWGHVTPLAGWIVMIVLVVLFSSALFVKDSRRRKSGLVAPPLSLTLIKMAFTAAVGIVLVVVCNLNRAHIGKLEGVPWFVFIVLGVFVAWTFLLQRTRFGRYIYAIGGNVEAARRAGINVAMVRTMAFVLCAVTAGIGGILYGSQLGGMSNNVPGGSLVLYAVAAAVIGGTSLFGGRGRMSHGILGGLMIGAITNGLGLEGLQAQWLFIVTGAVLLFAVIVDALTRRGSGSGSATRV